MFCGRNVPGIVEKSQLSSGLEQNEVAEERWDIREKKSLGPDPFGLCRHGKELRLYFRHAREPLEGSELINNLERSQ